jgi:A/G-specific adenine glycosylase
MLQQTQVATVIPYYNEWLRRFPDFAALARASEQEVLRAWQGLGYYARARNLRATAIAVVEKHGGGFPRELELIQALPGIGRYTASAIATFAFNHAVPVVEANIARLLARLIDLQLPIDTAAGRERLWSRAKAILPRSAAGVYNSALMDLGSLVCSVRPKCEMCPVTSFCAAREPSRLPRKKARPALKLLTEHHSFSVRRHRVLLEQSKDRWRGMWILPRLASPPSSVPLHRSEFPFTHHRIALTVFAQTWSPRRRNSSQRWFRIDDLDALPLPSPHRRALDELLRQPWPGLSNSTLDVRGRTFDVFRNGSDPATASR